MLAKASIPLVVLPLIVFAISVALQLIMLVLSTAALLVRGGSVATLWRQLPFFQLESVLFYSLAVIALWYAPIFAWLLLISAWARRTPFYGRAAAAGDRLGRVHYIPHHVLRILDPRPLVWIRAQRRST